MTRTSLSTSAKRARNTELNDAQLPHYPQIGKTENDVYFNSNDLSPYENFDTNGYSAREKAIFKANYAISKILVELTNLGYRNMEPSSVQKCLRELKNAVRHVNIVDIEFNKLKDAYRILLKKSICNTDKKYTDTLLIAYSLLELEGPQNIGFFNSFFGRKRTMLNKILLEGTEELVCNTFSKDDSYSTVEIVKFAKKLGCVKGPIPKIVREILKKHGLNFSDAFDPFTREVEYLCNKISTK